MPVKPIIYKSIISSELHRNGVVMQLLDTKALLNRTLLIFGVFSLINYENGLQTTNKTDINDKLLKIIVKFFRLDFHFHLRYMNFLPFYSKEHREFYIA